MPYCWEEEPTTNRSSTVIWDWQDYLKKKNLPIPPSSGLTPPFLALTSRERSLLESYRKQGGDNCLNLLGQGKGGLPDGESSAWWLLHRPGIGRVHFTKEVWLIEAGLHFFLAHLSKCIEYKCADFAFIPRLMGSMASNTKAGFHDEWDFRLDLNKLRIDVVDDDWLTSEEIMKIMEEYLLLPAQFYTIFEECLQEIAFEHDFLKFLSFGFKKPKGVCFFLFEWKNGEQNKELLLKTDIVPAVPINIKLQTGDLKQLPLSLVFWHKSNSQDVPALQISLCALESNFMKLLPDTVKHGYLLIKILSSCGLFSFPLANSSYDQRNSLTCCIEREMIPLLYHGRPTQERKVMTVARVINKLRRPLWEERDTTYKGFVGMYAILKPMYSKEERVILVHLQQTGIYIGMVNDHIKEMLGKYDNLQQTLVVVRIRECISKLSEIVKEIDEERTILLNDKNIDTLKERMQDSKYFCKDSTDLYSVVHLASLLTIWTQVNTVSQKISEINEKKNNNFVSKLCQKCEMFFGAKQKNVHDGSESQEVLNSQLINSWKGLQEGEQALKVAYIILKGCGTFYPFG